jgi:hypothetical protein
LASNCTTAGDTDALKKGCAPCPRPLGVWLPAEIAESSRLLDGVNWANHHRPIAASNTPGVLVIGPDEILMPALLRSNHPAAQREREGRSTRARERRCCRLDFQVMHRRVRPGTCGGARQRRRERLHQTRIGNRLEAK